MYSIEYYEIHQAEYEEMMNFLAEERAREEALAEEEMWRETPQTDFGWQDWLAEM